MVTTSTEPNAPLTVNTTTVSTVEAMTDNPPPISETVGTNTALRDGPTDNSGSGQSGSGTAPISIAAMAESMVPAGIQPGISEGPAGGPMAPTTGEATGLTHAELMASSILATGANVAQAVEAALAANGGPAPSDVVLQGLQAIHARLAGMEQGLAATAGAFSAAVTSGASADALTARVNDVETAVNSLATAAGVPAHITTRLEAVEAFVSDVLPLIPRILNFFNVHLGGKI